MANLINVIKENCTGCNACIRTCPVIEANVCKMDEDGRAYIDVDHDKCIGCGECTRTCTHNARTYNDDTEEFMEMVGKKEMALLVAPAFKAAYPNQWQSVLNWFKKNKVRVYDISYGADICSWAHLRAIDNHMVGNIISQPCAAIVNYITMYHPELLPNLSPVHSPVACEAIYLRKVVGLTMPLVMLSPCIAKKAECEATGLFQYSVTFKHLMEYFEKANIYFNTTDESFEYDFQDTQGLVGSVFSRPGGLRDNLWLENPDLNITTSEGVNKVYKEIDEYSLMPDFKHPEVFDVLSCEFGCNIGPGSGGTRSLFDVMSSMKMVEKSARKHRKTKGLFKEGADKRYQAFDAQLNLSDYLRKYEKAPSRAGKVSEKQMEEAFKKLEKTTEDEKNFDCHACGYAGCHDMARAIALGCNNADNCIVYAKKNIDRKHERMEVHQTDISTQVAKIGEFSGALIDEIDNIKSIVSQSDTLNASLQSQGDNISMMIRTLISFCGSVDTLDKQAIEKLIVMMNRVVDPLDKLLEQIGESTEQGKKVKEDFQKVYDLTNSLNEILFE